jgi:AcrR family transcriptional regulator
MRGTFQRARKPEEKEVRRKAILKAARKLLGEVSVADLSLNELARRSGVSKPNVYRYFESREDVLLQVWVEEIRDLSDRLDRSFSVVSRGDVPAVARAISAAFAARPALCELTSIVSAVLERNLSSEAILTAKMTLVELTARFAGQLHDRLPAISLSDCAWAASATAVQVVGLWPSANPGPATREVLARPELAGMGVVFERDLTRFLEVTFAGLHALAKAQSSIA